MLRKLLCLTMIAVLPGALLAADSGGAMLYAKGTAWHGPAFFGGLSR